MQKNVASMLNEQVNKEFYSAYLYLSFANYFVEQGLNGFANWYQVQAQEGAGPCHAVCQVPAEQ